MHEGCRDGMRDDQISCVAGWQLRQRTAQQLAEQMSSDCCDTQGADVAEVDGCMCVFEGDKGCLIGVCTDEKKKRQEGSVPTFQCTAVMVRER